MSEIISLPPPNDEQTLAALLARGASVKCLHDETVFTAADQVIPHFTEAHGWRFVEGRAV